MGGEYPSYRSAPQMHNVLAPAGGMKERVTEGTENESAENVTEWPRRVGFCCAPHGRVGLGSESRGGWGKGGTRSGNGAEFTFIKFNGGLMLL